MHGAQKGIVHVSATICFAYAISELFAAKGVDDAIGSWVQSLGFSHLALALCMYTAMGIAGSDLKKTTMNCLIWVGLHYALSVVCLMGILPIIGL